MLNWWYEDGPLVHRAISNADALFTTARSLNTKLQRKYGFESPLAVLPTPIALPSGETSKAPTPTVCYVGRLDPRKRPQLFCALAESFPDVRFILIGRSNNPKWDRELRETYGSLPNLEFVGFIDQFRSEELWGWLSKSWIYVNTSTREGVPTAMLEALAHGCAVLSCLNPDDIARRFGTHVVDDDFCGGLSALLNNQSWRHLGEAGRQFVHHEFALSRSIDKHIAMYRGLVRGTGG
jgi:glycosyltransferase involved in cell wall biosynthesis